MPFLSVVTRHLPARAELLQRNKDSLKNQTDPDFESIVFVDAQARGFAHAHKLLSDASFFVQGRYVLILDDDDYVSDRDAIKAFKEATLHQPPVVIFRGQHADLGILPARTWLEAPALGDIGCFDFILRADIYKEISRTTPAPDNPYTGDYAIIAAAFAQYQAQAVWLDRVICTADKRRLGLGDNNVTI